MPAEITSRRLIGRSAELAALSDALGDAAQGRPSTIVIVGPAGVGKSRLTEEFGASARASGARVLTGDCLEVVGAGLPFGPLAAMLRDLHRLEGADRTTALLGPAQPELAQLVPELAAPHTATGSDAATLVRPSVMDRVPTREGDMPEPDPADRWAAARLFEHLLGTFGRLGADAVTVAVFEDVQWIDSATRDLVTFLAHNLRSERVLLVLTFRSEHLPRHDPLVAWLTDLRRVARTRLLPLAPFTPDETSEQLSEILGTEAAIELAARIHGRSAGNPLFNEELLAATRAGSDALPSLLADVLLETVRRLPARTRQALRVAAVASRPFDERFLAAVLGGGDSDYLEPIRDAVVGQVLVADASTYRFRHELVAEAITADLTPGERRDLHARIATALDANPDLAEGGAGWVAAESADHWRAAGRAAEAFRRSVDAAVAAVGVHAHASADRRWEDALAILDGLEPDRRDPLIESVGLDRPHLLVRAAQAAGLAEAHERAVTLAERALREEPRPDSFEAGLLQSERARILWDAGHFEAAHDAHRRAVDLVEAGGSTGDWASVTSRFATMLLWEGRLEESIALARRAAEAAATAGLPAVAAEALDALGNGLRMAGSIREAIERLGEARRAALDSGGVEAYLFASDSLAECLVDADRFDEAVEVATAAEADARRSGLDRLYGAMFRGNAGLALFNLGHWQQADAVTGQGVDAGHGRVWALAGRARLLAATGRTGEARATLDSVGAAYPEGLPDIARLECALPRAELSLVEADPHAALETVEAALGVAAPHVGLRLALAATGVRAAADVAADGRASRAEAEIERAGAAADRCLAEVADQRRTLEGWDPSTPSKIALADLAAAEASRMRGEPDPEGWGAVAEAFERVPMPYPVAYAWYRQAEALLQLEGVRAAGAAALLQSAHERCRALGAAPLRTEIDRLAQHARVELGDRRPGSRGATTGAAERGETSLPRRRPSPCQGPRVGPRLSARERQVLSLVAAGRTNGQIAAELFISPKTASVHVTHILDKLGAGNRVEAAMIAARAGLLDSNGSPDD